MAGPHGDHSLALAEVLSKSTQAYERFDPVDALYAGVVDLPGDE